MRASRLLAIFLISFLTFASVAFADSFTQTNNPGQQAASDTVSWTQLGADQTLLTASFPASSANSLGLTVGLTGANSVVSVVCAASPCSWTGSGLGAGDSLLWTSDAGNSGNGPVTIIFNTGIAGAGAFIQANAPGQFQAQMQVFNGGTSLGTFNTTSDVAGDAVYLGVIDNSGSNITQVVYSINSCGPLDVSGCTDFAIDMLNLDAAVPTASTTTTLAASPNPATTAQNVTFTATVTSTGKGTLSGNVVFNIDGVSKPPVALSSGTAVFTTASPLAQGSHTATAAYQGATGFAASTSSPYTEVVSSGGTATTTTLGAPTFTPADPSSPNKQHVVELAHFTITVTPQTATGNLLLQANGVNLVPPMSLTSAPCSAGVSTITCTVIVQLPLGVDSVQAITQGNSTFAGSLSSVRQVEHTPRPH